MATSGDVDNGELETLGTFDAVVSLGPNCLPAYRLAKVGRDWFSVDKPMKMKTLGFSGSEKNLLEKT